MIAFFLIFFSLFNIFVVIRFVEYDKRINTLESCLIHKTIDEISQIMTEGLTSNENFIE